MAQRVLGAWRSRTAPIMTVIAFNESTTTVMQVNDLRTVSVAGHQRRLERSNCDPSGLTVDTPSTGISNSHAHKIAQC
jgi:hypothetical protein